MNMLAALLAAVAVSAASAPAGPLAATPEDAAITAAGAGVWIASEIAKPGLAPESCRFCEAEVNAVDRQTRRALVFNNTRPMALASDAGLYLAMPLSAALLTLGSRKPGTAALLVAQSAALTANVNQAVKFAVGRSRPYARFGHDVGKDPAGGDDHLSFFSGHSAVSFSLAAASYAWMRLEKPEQAPYAGAALFAGAAFVGYARIAADRHYLSDVLVGAVVGSAIGWATIEGHRRERATVSLEAQPAAVRVSMAF